MTQFLCRVVSRTSVDTAIAGLEFIAVKTVGSSVLDLVAVGLVDLSVVNLTTVDLVSIGLVVQANVDLATVGIVGLMHGSDYHEHFRSVHGESDKCRSCLVDQMAKEPEDQVKVNLVSEIFVSLSDINVVKVSLLGLADMDQIHNNQVDIDLVALALVCLVNINQTTVNLLSLDLAPMGLLSKADMYRSSWIC